MTRLNITTIQLKFIENIISPAERRTGVWAQSNSIPSPGTLSKDVIDIVTSCPESNLPGNEVE